MKVAFLPVYSNPYQRLLGNGLALHGVSVEMLAGLPSVEWLRANQGRIDILHFHWLYGLYMARFLTPGRVAQFLGRLRLAGNLGYRVVWTAHNILPHRSGVLRPLHVTIRRRMMTAADAVIVHCEAGRRELLARFPRYSPTYTIPIGSYSGQYPVRANRQTARTRLGLDEGAFVYLALGNIAAYKGLERFADIFMKTADGNDIAVIAGRNRDASVVRRLRRRAKADPRIRLHDGYIPDDEMQGYLSSADVMVAPFERVLTSSSVMVALSYGLPVIVPNLGCLPELVGAAGLVYNAGDPDALSRALAESKQTDLAAMSEKALVIAGGLRWDEIGRLTATVYHACLAGSLSDDSVT